MRNRTLCESVCLAANRVIPFSNNPWIADKKKTIIIISRSNTHFKNSIRTIAVWSLAIPTEWRRFTNSQSLAASENQKNNTAVTDFHTTAPSTAQQNTLPYSFYTDEICLTALAVKTLVQNSRRHLKRSEFEEIWIAKTIPTHDHWSSESRRTHFRTISHHCREKN